MNTHLLNEIYQAKEERRKRLIQLPIAEKVLIIERLRDMAVALRAAREEFSRKYAPSTSVTGTVTLPAKTALSIDWVFFAPIEQVCPDELKKAFDAEEFALAA